MKPTCIYKPEIPIHLINLLSLFLIGGGAQDYTFALLASSPPLLVFYGSCLLRIRGRNKRDPIAICQYYLHYRVEKQRRIRLRCSGMLSGLMNFLRACFRPRSDQYSHTSLDTGGRQDGLLWYKDTGQHVSGEFSMAVVQANNLLEDQSQLESGCLSLNELGPYGTFVGVYDGHGGPETSRFINEHLFQHLKRKYKAFAWDRGLCLDLFLFSSCTSVSLMFTIQQYLLCSGFTSEQQTMSVDVIRKAYQATEEGFLSLVTKQWPMKPQIAAVGSCCLVGVICGGTLYVANLGDSRAVLGRAVKATGEVLAIQLSAEHNVCIESVRQELQSLHPDDSQIVVLKHNVWRVKGLIQVIFIWSCYRHSRESLPEFSTTENATYDYLKILL
ncbi:putative protein phosphatase 2C 60 isoform X1 [Gossypium australe]|uniref:protein-serine/threonine phosphatase n=1 Tax=Gossypium australe TaxID=47621 RepID=A0A5B6V0Z8_9ROSI|nr:putative protein phosphatase 2C 60 isoform X1 [Gossypium australe]